MKEKSVLTTFTETLEKNRALRTVLTGALILAAFILFLTSGVFRSCGKTAEEPTQETSGNIGAQTAELEKRLEGMLSSMAGVGRVKVMLTLDSTEEQILAETDMATDEAVKDATEFFKEVKETVKETVE